MYAIKYRQRKSILRKNKNAFSQIKKKAPKIFKEKDAVKILSELVIFK